MRNALLAVVALVLGFSIAQAAPRNYGKQAAMNRTRACIPVAGGDSTVSLTTSSAASTQLSEKSVYYITSSADVFLEFGTAAATATTSSWLLPANTVFPFATDRGTGTRYLAGILAAGTGTLYLMECQ